MVATRSSDVPWTRISAAEWDLISLADDQRRRLLYSAPDGQVLVDRIAAECLSASGVIELHWQPACENQGYFRVIASTPCDPQIFDWLFNGPSGYRAHYYRDADIGEAFNKQAAETMIEAVLRSHAWPEFKRSEEAATVASLRGQWTKVWAGGGPTTFQTAPKGELRPTRWVKNCRPCDMGLRAPLPENPVIDLIGTWVHPVTLKTWLSPDKVDRADRLHQRGFV
jgi:hypothetical protein